ncbi:unnamed protein product [Rhizophagus irregularis]|nr:unnamed protein product [Rhizophagus irregularis]CAB4419405.1 unnamed protein product [Rhizophagus irregularis]
MGSVHQDDTLTVPIKINLNSTLLLTMDNNLNPTDNGSNQPPTVNQVQTENSSKAPDDSEFFTFNITGLKLY